MVETRAGAVSAGTGYLLLSSIIGAARRTPPRPRSPRRIGRSRAAYVPRRTSCRPVRSWFRRRPSNSARCPMRRCRIRPLMRHLGAGGRPRREADPDVVIAKHLGGAAARGRLQRASGGERDWCWRLIHELPPCCSFFLVLDSTLGTRLSRRHGVSRFPSPIARSAWLATAELNRAVQLLTNRGATADTHRASGRPRRVQGRCARRRFRHYRRGLVVERVPPHSGGGRKSSAHQSGRRQIAV
jgi:hypothetical protein